MLVNILLLVAGCVLLYFGAEWLVRGAAGVAGSIGISKSVIGLTLVAFGTSAPEFFVNVIAGIRGESGFALSNVSGSNLTNICTGFGICGLLGGISIGWQVFRADFFMLVVSAAIVTAIMFATGLFSNGAEVPLWSVLPMLIVFGLYLRSLLKRHRTDVSHLEPNRRQRFLDCLLFLAGVLALYGGGEIVLANAVVAANRLGIDPTIIGLTIVAFGTSIPDVMASIIAWRRGETEIAVGNLVGSNISNSLAVLSGTLLAGWAPLKVGANQVILLDYTFVCVVSIVLLGLALFKGRVGRISAAFLVVSYVGYIALRVFVEIWSMNPAT